LEVEKERIEVRSNVVTATRDNATLIDSDTWGIVPGAEFACDSGLIH
jgi:hypothetical protein